MDDDIFPFRRIAGQPGLMSSTRDRRPPVRGSLRVFFGRKTTKGVCHALQIESNAHRIANRAGMGLAGFIKPFLFSTLMLPLLDSSGGGIQVAGETAEWQQGAKLGRNGNHLHSIIFVTKRPGGYDVLLEALARQTSKDYELICVDELADSRRSKVAKATIDSPILCILLGPHHITRFPRIPSRRGRLCRKMWDAKVDSEPPAVPRRSRPWRSSWASTWWP